MSARNLAILSSLRSLIVAAGWGGAVASVHADPVVSNLTASQRAGTKLVDIAYDLAAPGFGAVAVTLEASSDDGATWTVPVTSATGGGRGGRDAWNGDRHGSPGSPTQRKGQRGGDRRGTHPKRSRRNGGIWINSAGSVIAENFFCPKLAKNHTVITNFHTLK